MSLTMSYLILQHFRRAFLSLTEEFWPEHNRITKENILNGVRSTNPTATIEDAKDVYIAYCIPQKLTDVPNVDSAAVIEEARPPKPGSKR